MKRVRDYQTLIAGLTLAVSIFTAAGAILGLVFRMGQAVSQHEQIITSQGHMLQMINDKCK